MKKYIFLLLKNTFIRGGVYLTAANFIGGFLNYLFNIFVGRALGPQGYGEITALFSYIVIFTIPIGVISTTLIQKIGSANDGGAYSLALENWLLSKLRRFWFLIIIFFGITPFLPQVTSLTPLAAYILPILIVLAFIGSFYNGALQGLHLFFWLSFIGIFATLLKLAGAVMALFGWGDVNTVVLFILISSSLPLLVTKIVFTKKTKASRAKTHIIRKKILHIFTDKQLWYTAGVTATLALIGNIDIIIVKKLFNAQQAGYYSLWVLYAKIILYALGPLLTLTYIFFSNNKQRMYHQLVFISSFIVLIFIGIATNLGYRLYGKELIYMLFGATYLPILPYLDLASLFGTGYVMMMFMTYYFLAKKSIVALIPTLLLPLYIIALIIYPNQIAEMMAVNIAYTFVSVIIFLLVFFKERILFLLRG